MKYFTHSFIFAASSFTLVTVVFLITDSLLGIAFATTVSYILWFLFTTRIEYSFLKSSNKELILLLSHFIVFYYSASSFTMYTGFAIYFVYVLIVGVALRKELTGLLKFVRKS